MSVRGFIGGAVRGLVIAAATAGAAFGALVVFDPFATPVAVPVTTAVAPASQALQQRIETLRLALRDAEAAIVDAGTAPSPVGDTASRAQYEAQIAAATERRDLALRHAAAIRDSLAAGATPASLAAIRDSVVIGQLLGQQAALDAQIAIDGARLRPNHPTMRALTAQRTSLATQIRQEASNIASALEAEAKLDDAQIELLRDYVARLPAPAAAPDIGGLTAKAAAQRAELDGLVDAYFNIPAADAPAVAPGRNILGVANLAVVAIAAIAAIFFQLFLAARRRRAATEAADLAAWRADRDPEFAEPIETEPQREAA